MDYEDIKRDLAELDDEQRHYLAYQISNSVLKKLDIFIEQLIRISKFADNCQNIFDVMYGFSNDLIKLEEKVENIQIRPIDEIMEELINRLDLRRRNE